jgi:hypothetical protein
MASDRECNPALKSVHPRAHVATLRGQVAIVRTLLDEFERVLSRRSGDEDVGPVSAAEQLSDELRRLSHELRQMTEAFPASLRNPEVPVAEASGARAIGNVRTG